MNEGNNEARRPRGRWGRPPPVKRPWIRRMSTRAWGMGKEGDRPALLRVGSKNNKLDPDVSKMVLHFATEARKGYLKGYGPQPRLQSSWSGFPPISSVGDGEGRRLSTLVASDFKRDLLIWS